MIFRRTALCVAILALAAPGLFILSILKILPLHALWDSPEAARIQSTLMTRRLLIASMIVVPVAASAYGAMASRRRVLGGVLGFLLGAALWLANVLCLDYVAEPRSSSVRRSAVSARLDGTSAACRANARDVDPGRSETSGGFELRKGVTPPSHY